MIGIVVVSHSAKAAEGISEIAAQMSADVPIVAAGGDPVDGAGDTDGDFDTPAEIGTSVERIQTALVEADSGDGVVVLVDLGSAVMNAELAIEMVGVDAVIADAPVLEGTLNAAGRGGECDECGDGRRESGRGPRVPKTRLSHGASARSVLREFAFGRGENVF